MIHNNPATNYQNSCVIDAVDECPVLFEPRHHGARDNQKQDRCAKRPQCVLLHWLWTCGKQLCASRATSEQRHARAQTHARTQSFNKPREMSALNCFVSGKPIQEVGNEFLQTQEGCEKLSDDWFMLMVRRARVRQCLRVPALTVRQTAPLRRPTTKSSCA